MLGLLFVINGVGGILGAVIYLIVAPIRWALREEKKRKQKEEMQRRIEKDAREWDEWWKKVHGTSC